MKKEAKKTVCVIGLGYVGLPLAVRAKEKGYETYGFELDKTKVDLINRKKSPIKEEFLEKNLPKFPIVAGTDENIIAKADIVLICVPTPVDKNYYPDLGPVRGASETVARNLKRGALVVLESTVNPGVSEEVVAPIFEKAGFKIGKDVFIAHCPERIDPGNKKWNVTNLPRVVGSFDKKGLEMAVEFYENITTGEVRPMKSIREAEAVKIVENSFRDVNIAFVNELAKSFDKLGIDIKDVIEGASTKFSFMPHFPSCGVGGHCIPVDPYYLIERAKASGFDHKFLRVAREINNSMPEYTVNLLQNSLNEIKKPMKDTAVGVLGIAYKADIDDVRESPAIKIIELLKNHGVKVFTYDPFILEKSTEKSLADILEKSEAIVLVTNHSQFLKIKPSVFKKNNIRVIIDGKNCLDKKSIEKIGILYKGIGH